MKSIYVNQIYDSLSEKVIHTFMSPNADYARNQFSRFLESVKKYSDLKNFKLLYVCSLDICETSQDCISFMESNPGEFEDCFDVGLGEEESEDESEN